MFLKHPGFTLIPMVTIGSFSPRALTISYTIICCLVHFPPYPVMLVRRVLYHQNTKHLSVRSLPVFLATVQYNVKTSLCKFLTSLTKLMFQVKPSIRSTIKENLLLYCDKFLKFILTLS